MGEQRQIWAKRNAAARVRQVAQGLQGYDRRRMVGLADALDAEADALERRVPTAAAPRVTQIQMQVQQGPPAQDDPEKDKS